MRIGLIVILICFQSAMAEPDFRTTFDMDGNRDRVMEAGERSDWSFSYINSETGLPHKMFMDMHAKKMHMLVIKSDLSHLAHVHPSFSMMTGLFSIAMNTLFRDPDNMDLPRAVTNGGRYFVFTEVMPMVPNTEMNMLMDRFEVRAEGETRSVPPMRFKDARNTLTRFYKENGELGSAGDYYKVEFSYQQFDFCDRWMPKFYYQFYTNSRAGYQLAKDFTPWLEMGGHSVLIDADNPRLEDKVFHHLHAFLPMATEGQFVFPYHDHKNEMPEGNYKIWGQFKHNNKILKVSFPFKYTHPDEPSGECR